MRASNDRVGTVHEFVSGVFGDDLHAKRVLSLSYGALGVVTSASLAVAMIGHGLSQARGVADKHAIKQVDRLLSNRPRRALGVVRAVGRARRRQAREDRGGDGLDRLRRRQSSTLALHLVTGHGRATPLIWLTVDKDELKNRRNNFEDACLSRLKETLPEGVAVTILADRGFGDVKLFAFLQSLGFDYAIRFRGNIHVTAADGETRLAADWVGKGGRARMLRDVEITAARRPVPSVVCVHAKGMKEPWCIAASLRDGSAREIVNHYAKRWTIEPGFRDEKNLRFGMGLSALRIADPQRRDRLLLLSALAVVLLTLLGAAGESLGMDRLLKSNTSKRRTHSLFRQGCLLYDLIPNMPETRLRPLVEKYAQLLKQNSPFTQVFGFV